jgi:hypothetical protein
MTDHSYRVITHIHSVSSDDLASPGYGVVRSLIERGFGSTAPGVTWRECDISVADLESILDGSRTRKPVDLLFLTDHMSPRQHRIAPAAFDLARRCHRFGIGGEIQTCLPDGSGSWIIGPDVLLYGEAQLQPGPGGGYYGVTQAIIDEAFESATAPGAPMPDTFGLRAFCEGRGIACALAHPLDGHDLPLRQLLDVLGSFDFVETINGGYSHANATLLTRVLGTMREAQSPRNGREIDRHDPAPGECPRPALIALGGADAHVNDFDRVVTLFRHEGGPPTAGDFLLAMLEARKDPEKARARFVPAGRGIRFGRLVAEVVLIGTTNLARNRHLLPGWGRVADVFGAGMAVIARQLLSKRSAAGTQRRQLDEWLRGDDDDQR